MRLEPGQQADDWQDRARDGGLRSTQGKVAGPFPDRLAAPGRHAEGGAAGEGQVSNGTRPRPPPDVPELRM